MKILLSLLTQKGRIIHQMHVESALLNGASRRYLCCATKGFSCTKTRGEGLLTKEGSL